MHCPRCEFENPAGMKFCGECGSPLANRCPACEFENPPGFKFCGSCGASLGEAPAAPAAAPAPAPSLPLPMERDDGSGDVERRQITVAFCDLVGSTDLSETLDPEEFRDLVRAYQKAAADVITRYDGHIAQYLGDGLLVYFGYPVAHEDDPVRAVYAGLEILDSVSALHDAIALPDGVRLQARVGIHTGLVVAGEMGSGERRERLAMGQTPNVAARLEGLAAPGEAVLSRTTQRLVGGQFELESLGLKELRGVTEPLEVFRVAGVARVEDPFELLPQETLTPLVGRNREVEQLVDLWIKATSGQGQVVLLQGDPGVGKSRLTRAFRSHVEEHPHSYLWVRGQAFNESSTFSPVVEMLERMCEIRPEDGEGERFEKLQTRLRARGLEDPEDAVLLCDLLEIQAPDGYPVLDLPPRRRKQRMMETLVQLMRTSAEQEPLLLVVEDLHWVDPSTHEFLEQLVTQGPTHPMLTFFTTRPHVDPQWASRSYVTRLTLRSLGQEEVESMVLRVTGGKPIPAPLLEQIVAKTDGVPLFVEELTKTILESDLLQEREDRYELTGPLEALAIPASLQDSLNARLDILKHGKEVAQTAAAIDREFSYGLLRAVWPKSEEALQTGLRELVAGEFLYQRGIPPHSSYIFKHALIQDAATESLVRSRRQKIHRSIARVLEAVHRHRMEGVEPDAELAPLLEHVGEAVEHGAERIALHFTQGGQALKAVDWWLTAARKGLARCANQEVVEHMSRAAELLDTLDPTPENRVREYEVQSMLGAALTGTRGYAAPEVETAFTRALEIARETEEHGRVFQAQLGLWMFHVVRADFPNALRGANALMALAREHDDRSYLVEASFALGCTSFFMGRPRRAVEELEVGIAADGLDRDRSISRMSGQDAGTNALVYVGMARWMLGEADEAVSKADESIQMATELGHTYSVVYARHFTSWLRLWMGHMEEAERHSDEVIRVSGEMGYFWVTLGSIVRGSVRVAQGKAAEGAALMDWGLGAYRGAGARLSQTLQLALRAEAALAQGEVDEGLAFVEEALEAIRETDERFWEVDLHRLRGELLRDRDSAGAEAAMRFALETARSQGNVGLGLRAALALAGFLDAQGRGEDALPELEAARALFKPSDMPLPDVDEADRMLAALQG